ncbi:MAG: hypothetical protein K2F79_00280 [Muribaculaceae bacterium]|nr:hypothetical protein [Muribaculaceae bacterium]
MKNIPPVLTSLLLVILASCSQSDDPVPASDTVQAGIYITVSSAAPDQPSRAVPDNEFGYNPGEGYENYIHISGDDFRVYFFTSSNVLIARLENPELVPTSSTVTSKRYLLTCEVRPEELSANFKVVMLANWRNYPELTPGVSTIDDLVKSPQAQLSYRRHAQALLTPDERIPLFGVKEYSVESFNKYTQTVLPGELHLLRAYAKIEVYASAYDGQFPIVRADLIGHNTRAWAAPHGVYNESDYVHWNYDQDFAAITEFESVTDEALEFCRDEAGHYILYVPEYRNAGTGRPAKIRIYFEDPASPEATPYFLDFKYYKADIDQNIVAGQVFDIRRNYWYRYEVIKTNADLDLTVDVLPFQEVRLDPIFGVDVPESGN